MKEKGWGDLSYNRIEDFQNSDQYKNPKDEQEFAEQFDDYLTFDSTHPYETDLDLSIELENKYRKGVDFDEDEFLSSLGVSDDEMQSITFWTSLELGREKYMNMSDEEFSKAYDLFL